MGIRLREGMLLLRTVHIILSPLLRTHLDELRHVGKRRTNLIGKERSHQHSFLLANFNLLTLDDVKIKYRLLCIKSDLIT